MNPTDQQQEIIDYPSNAVIIAAPGSGKTFVVSEKIRKFFEQLLEFEGVVAISYTNKSSNELRERCLRNGINSKSSFFGTIDKFFISEIIIPFAKHVFGIPANDIKIVKIDSLSEDEQNSFSWFSRGTTLDNLTDENIEILKYFFLKGIISIESVGVFADYIFTNSLACKNYIKARYKYIFIDEYQDSGANQHEIFLKIVGLGVVGVAVGDLNQSIYAFSGKNSRFLSSLRQDEHFKPFFLTQNHRCHPSIINYSNYFLDPTVPLMEADELRVVFCSIQGGDQAIANWIDQRVERIKQMFQIQQNSDIAILTRWNRKIDAMKGFLVTPTKVSITADLDMSLNVWSSIFSSLLRFVYDPTFRFIEVVEVFTTFDRLNKPSIKALLILKEEIAALFQNEIDADAIRNKFILVAQIIAPNSQNQESVELLDEVLRSQELLDSYRPARPDQLNLMTIHKSKGLEFDVIIHLELNEWVFPQKRPGANNDFNNPVYTDLSEDRNIHYVALTRAKKGCILLNGSQRTNNDGETRQARDSEFIWQDNIRTLRR